MTAVSNDSQSRVPPISEPNLCYFSRYHAFVAKSIWDPLASGVFEGVKDLIGRVVIITTALLGGYLIAALFSIRFWCSTPPPPSAGPSAPPFFAPGPSVEQRLQAMEAEQAILKICDRQKQGDIVSHTHHQIVHPSPALPQEQILKLRNPQTLQEEDCIYTGDLTVEKSRIKILVDEAKVQMLVGYISKMDRREKEEFAKPHARPSWITYDMSPKWNSKNYALAALFVILGIKPALAIEYQTDKELITLLTNLAHDHSSLHYESGSSGVGYFVNEHPFSSF